MTPEYVDVTKVKEAVARKLPYYCVHSRVVGLEKLPKTGNGKVDKRALKNLTECENPKPALIETPVSRSPYQSAVFQRDVRV